MQHIFQKGTDPSKPTLVLLHGTGGTEHDLLPIAQIVSPESSVLSVRGNVLEHGMPRFFRRLSEGVFDEEDLIFRTNELNEFLNEAATKYELDRSNFIAVGYSNGANIAGSLLFHHKGSLRGAILHHPMVPRRGLKLPDLAGSPVFIGAGTNDPICAPQETEELQSLLTQAGARVTVHWEQHGHQLTHSEVHAAASWLQSHINQG
ncbi:MULTISPECIES: alpha/beta hydrolase [Paenibacillus]|uniref:Alpha/beta hydrolase n=1 Tax=Paenibacillus alvei TaxID=44250 RepID=A0AAP7DI92_PAEAL|nr:MULTISPECIES: alpha/beta hydrolase [Paenibacillus]MBG9736897.1 carboxylesterase [Paenibacillus alvei]MBG9746419.1 carboxylesterase [Paenibacillus alvei]MCY9579255.1 alpha/beta hydrolase [Paenibacillus alvei]MCY9583711.1 alpha/beta hydrolase [Paenibacillus alvei]NOJ71332.1 alpha/beta hydrolase [Paenibacillus alvei]